MVCPFYHVQYGMSRYVGFRLLARRTQKVFPAPRVFFLDRKNELDGMLYWYAWARPNTAHKIRVPLTLKKDQANFAIPLKNGPKKSILYFFGGFDSWVGRKEEKKGRNIFPPPLLFSATVDWGN